MEFLLVSLQLTHSLASLLPRSCRISFLSPPDLIYPPCMLFTRILSLTQLEQVVSLAIFDQYILTSLSTLSQVISTFRLNFVLVNHVTSGAGVLNGNQNSIFQRPQTIPNQYTISAQTLAASTHLCEVTPMRIKRRI